MSILCLKATHIDERRKLHLYISSVKRITMLKSGGKLSRSKSLRRTNIGHEWAKRKANISNNSRKGRWKSITIILVYLSKNCRNRTVMYNQSLPISYKYITRRNPCLARPILWLTHNVPLVVYFIALPPQWYPQYSLSNGHLDHLNLLHQLKNESASEFILTFVLKHINENQFSIPFSSNMWLVWRLLTSITDEDWSPMLE